MFGATLCAGHVVDGVAVAVCVGTMRNIPWAASAAVVVDSLRVAAGEDTAVGAGADTVTEDAIVADSVVVGAGSSGISQWVFVFLSPSSASTSKVAYKSSKVAYQSSSSSFDLESGCLARSNVVALDMSAKMFFTEVRVFWRSNMV